MAPRNRRVGDSAGGREARLGVLGGSFDPVHCGHLSIAESARRHFGLETVCFVPAGQPPHKTTSVQAPAADRLEMLRLALDGASGARIWDGEISRPGPSFTIDTLDELEREYPGRALYFIIGADNLSEISTWHRFRDVLSRVILCVTGRPGYSDRIPPELAGADIRQFPSPGCEVSSREIRRRVAQGLPCEGLVPPAVAAHIGRKGLYRRERAGA